MFIVSLNYKVPLAEIDAMLDAHRAFLDRHFTTGVFLASGPKEPRTGGVILACKTSRQALESILAQDPFHQLGLADYAIETVQFSRFSEALPETCRHLLGSRTVA